MPGFGNSSEPKNIWNLDNFVKFIISFIDKLELNDFDLIGHSNGGRIILKMISCFISENVV